LLVIFNKPYKISNEYQNTLHQIIKRFYGIPGFIESLSNMQQNLTMVTNNWFNYLPQLNHLLPYGTFIFSLDEERRRGGEEKLFVDLVYWGP